MLGGLYRYYLCIGCNHYLCSMNMLEQRLARLRNAAAQLNRLDTPTINHVLCAIADHSWAERQRILDANALDLLRMDPADPKYDRLQLTESRIAGIVADIRRVAALPSPLGHVLESFERPNGLRLTKVSVPIGVLGVVYESRPNVTFDVSALCLKTGNSVALKGSRDASDSNHTIVEIIHEVLAKYDLQDAVFLAPAEREALTDILRADRYIDAIIPRGSQGLIDHVRANATVPVIETGAGIVHTYFDHSADLATGQVVVENAKARRVSVCNALDTLLIHQDRLSDLSALLKRLGQVHHCQIFADIQAHAALSGHYPDALLHPLLPEHFGTEFLSMQLAVGVVAHVNEAIHHINRYGSKHSEAIIAQDEATVEAFMQQVDAAVVYANTSTAFTDGGEFGFGAEIGISTQKLHARGPMGLRELTSYKWLVRGQGQVRG
jgi:glutamate-5-semialdehyde dehydrogenase